MIFKILATGACAGMIANVTGYLITGRVFHRYQARTPHTWRTGESWMDYTNAALLRIAGCMAVGALYVVLAPGLAPLISPVGLRGAGFGAILWAATILPLVLELALFVKWHTGFVVGLLVDWLVVCLLASTAAAVAAA
jgi:hypothetical protein